MFEDALVRWAGSRGYQVAWAPMNTIHAVRSDIERRLQAGEIDGAFARENLAFCYPSVPSCAGRSLLMVVMPRPAHAVAFMSGGRKRTAVMPPTYERYRPTFEDVHRDLAANVLQGCGIEQLNAPLKPLAAALGLVRYGRNNLAYTEATGSYLQLLGYAIDAALTVAAGWAPCAPRLLERCRTCQACERACPTGAILRERVLLRAERCLTYANETPGSWPPWISPSAHHCLIGCLQCQIRCPANPPLALVETGVIFAEDETLTLLAEGDRQGEVWRRIRAKLEQLGQPYQEEVMGRNLRAWFAADRTGSREKAHA